MHETVQQKVSLLEKRVGPNSKSPLFAQLASYYLLAGRANDALKVCDEGIANFPFYTTGHLIKAKVLIALKMTAEARRELEIVREFLPTNATINKFLTDVPGAPGEIGETPGARVVQPKAKVEAPPPPPEPVTIVETAPTVEPPAPEQTQEATPVADMFGLTGTEAPAARESPTPPAPEPAGAFEAAGQVSTDAFGAGAAPPQTEAPTVEAVPTPAESSSPFAGFEAPPSVEAPPAEEPFAGLAPAVPGEETFEQFSARRMSELAGQENSMSLEEYFGESSTSFGPPQEAEPPKPAENPNEIEELAQKLQGAKKITPVINLSDKSTTTASESESPASTGFVTPTLAEIYAKQGWFDDAIKAYRTLAINKPAEKEKFEKRIAELEELRKQKG